MTTGTKTNVEGWPPNAVGDFYRKSWSGTDYGGSPPVKPDSTRVVERLGLGAAAARDIFTELAESARREKGVDSTPEARQAAYEKRLQQRQNRSDQRWKERLNDIVERDARAKARKANNEWEKSERKRLHLPFKPRPTWSPVAGVAIPVRHQSIHYHRELPQTPPSAPEEHPYEMEYLRTRDSECSLLIGNPAHAGPLHLAMTHGYPSWISGTTLLDDNDQLKLLADLATTMRGDHDFHAPSFMTELPMTVRTIGDSIVRLAKAGWHMRRGDWTGAGRSLLEGTTRAPLPPRKPSVWGNASSDANTLSARLLEYKYAITPLMSDIHTGAQALAYALMGRGTRAKYVVSTRRFKEVDHLETWSKDNGLGRLNSLCMMRHSRRIVAYFSAPPTLGGPEGYLGLTDPYSLAGGLYEGAPFSFVADWAYPMGDYLAANSALENLPSGVYVVTDTKRSVVHAPRSADFALAPSPESRREYVSVKREIRNSLSAPLPRLKTLGETFTFSHTTSALALLTQAFTGLTTRAR